MQQQPPPKTPPPPPRRGGFVQPPGILFDSDIGRNIDTVLALALLHGLGPKGRVIAAGVSSGTLEAAAFCEVLSRVYIGEPSTGPMRTAAPVGLVPGKNLTASTPILRGALSKKDDAGKPLFRHSIESEIDTADPCVLYRNALMSQKPGEGKFVLAGPATNLAKLVRMGGMAELIKDRIGFLVVALGAMTGDKPDPSVLADIASARILFEHWPTPIVVAGLELAQAISFPGAKLEAAFSWAPVHPVVEAYKANHAMPYDAPAQALAAALYAGNAKEDFFQLSAPGAVQVADNGRTVFTAAAEGRHRYLSVDPAQVDRIREAFVTTISTKPAPPRRPF
jgi:hypothetical protein